MKYKGLTLDQFQEDAIASIDNNHSVVVSAPTGSGKTLIADYIINKYLKKQAKVIYTAPIKALSNQKFKQFSDEYGPENVGLLTGDIVKNPGAPILIMTTEIFRNMAMVADPLLDTVSYAIFDETHYINDRERGYVWEESIIFAKSHIRFLCLSATIPNADEFAEWIQAIKKHTVDIIKHHWRNVPLHKSFYDTELGVTTLEDIQAIIDIPDERYIRGKRKRRRPFMKPPNHVELVREIKNKVPCFFFAFSRKKCQDFAKDLAKARVFKQNPEITTYVRKKLANAHSDIKHLKSTQLLRQTLPYGIGFHHAGLLPIIKELVEELFGQGLIKVLYTTETFAVGINMPAKSVCFESLRKFDGVNFRFLNSKEYFQIAGRAGRRGIDKEGFVYAMINRRDFEYRKIKRMTTKDVDPIKSQFRLSVNTVLNLIKQHNKKEIDTILGMSFHTYQRFGKEFSKHKDVFLNKFAKIKKQLERMHYVKDDVLTEKGEFSSRIYADEILTGELFATDFYKQLNEYQYLLLVASLCYEPRERTQFYKKYVTPELKDLKRKARADPYLKRHKRWFYLNDLSAMIYPCYTGKNLFAIMKNTNLLEGDLIRFFRQMIDRIGQIRIATKDRQLQDRLISCQKIIIDCLQDIDVL